jgi:hypothetical protein
MKKTVYLALVLVSMHGLLTSCSEKSDAGFDQENFTSIFDNNQFTVANYPIDVRQTSDGGYLILAERRLRDSNFRGIYLMKADKTGKFVSALEVEEQYVNPVGDLLATEGQFGFFCMDGASLQVQFVQVDENATSTTIIPAGGGVTYPTAAAADGNGFLLLSYDHENKETVMSRHLASGDVIGTPRRFTIGAGDDVDEPIMNHFIRTGKRLPFQVGHVPGGPYFFNGFENYTLSLVFTDLGGNGADGVLQGYQENGGFSAIHPLGGNKFAASRFNFGDNYFLPNVTLPVNGTASVNEMGGNSLPELVSNAPVKIISVQAGNKNLLVYASDTKSKQIGLFFYDESNGEFISSRYLGFSNPFEMASIIQTSDGGLAVCGTTYLAGRFPRICLIKISKGELAAQAD